MLSNWMCLGVLLAFTSLAHAADAVDCQNAQTQTDMNICAGQDYAQADKQLNQTYQAYRARLDAEHQQSLKIVQLAWIKYRDLHCKFASQDSEGGSIHALEVASCLTEKTRQRTAELTQLNCLSGGSPCP